MGATDPQYPSYEGTLGAASKVLDKIPEEKRLQALFLIVVGVIAFAIVLLWFLAKLDPIVAIFMGLFILIAKVFQIWFSQRGQKKSKFTFDFIDVPRRDR